MIAFPLRLCDNCQRPTWCQLQHELKKLPLCASVPETPLIQESGKIRLDLVPAAALREEAKALEAGYQKDGRWPFNWRQSRVLARDHAAGALRHILAWLEGEDIDADSGAHHLGAARARLGIILDARAHGMLVDDRVIGSNKKNEKEKP